MLKPALEAIERTSDEAAIASDLLIDALRSTDQDPAQLERVDERLFGLQAPARKHGTDVDSLTALRDGFAAKLERLDDADHDLSRLETEAREAQACYDTVAQELHNAGFLPQRHSGVGDKRRTAPFAPGKSIVRPKYWRNWLGPAGRAMVSTGSHSRLLPIPDSLRARSTRSHLAEN